MTDDDLNRVQQMQKIADAAQILARELRLMAAGKEEYRDFKTIGRQARSLLSTAATLIEMLETCARQARDPTIISLRLH